MNRQIKDLMAQAQKMQAGLSRLQEELAGARIEGGSGPVKAIVTGQGELVDLRIAPEVFQEGDVSMLEDLILVSIRDAAARSREFSANRMKELGLPDTRGLM